MTELILQGPQPFDLILERDTTTVAEGESVAATLPIFVPGFPENVAQIRLLLNPYQAEQLARGLQEAALRARKYAGQF
jgi:hypothetical protein